MTRHAAILALAFLLLGPAGASASSVNVSGSALHYTGDAGPNFLYLTYASGTFSVVDTSGVILSAGSGCTNPENDNSASCTGTVNFLDLAGGGGGDTLNAGDPSLP